MQDPPLLDAPRLAALAVQAAPSPCHDCERLGAAGWESLPDPGAAAHLQPVGTLREDPFSEPTLAEHHPDGTRYWSPEAPIAPAWFPYNRCEVARCPRCGHVFLRYTEYGGYYQEARIRAADARRIVDVPAPSPEPGPAVFARMRPPGRFLPRLLLLAAAAAATLWLTPCAAGEPLAATPAATWLDPAGQPGPLARQALALLASAAEDGLDPADYALPAGWTGPAWETALDDALLRYARDLHQGRVAPGARDFHHPAETPPFDAAAWLAAARRGGDLATAAASLAPQISQYGALKQVLATYRALAARPGPAWPAGTPAKLLPGDAWEGLPALRTWLQAYGDLPPDTPPPADPQRYDAALVAAVQAFQRRHGLQDDGVLGRGTQAALRVTPAERVRQIEASMERLRWLPRLSAPRGLSINIPTFSLRVWEGVGTQAHAGLGMNVIVGSALDTRTPVMLQTLRYVVFRPYWNVPRSILLKEILPKWAVDPGYLRRQQLEIVQGQGDDARVLGDGGEHRAGLQAGTLRLRQRPGAKNSLGLVKFVFPNDAAVYLHGTPQPQLFERSRRDLSHGCVRVSDPVALAEWVLRDTPGWDRARIEQAMAAGDNRRVDLPQPLPVLLYYLTAVVSPDDARPHFATDLYGHDARLAAALKSPDRNARAAPTGRAVPAHQ